MNFQPADQVQGVPDMLVQRIRTRNFVTVSSNPKQKNLSEGNGHDSQFCQ